MSTDEKRFRADIARTMDVIRTIPGDVDGRAIALVGMEMAASAIETLPFQDRAQMWDAIIADLSDRRARSATA